MRRPLQPCGTQAAYHRHLSHHEVPCEPCYAAERRYANERRWLREVIHVLACAMGVGRDTA